MLHLLMRENISANIVDRAILLIGISALVRFSILEAHFNMPGRSLAAEARGSFPDWVSHE